MKARVGVLTTPLLRELTTPRSRTLPIGATLISRRFKRHQRAAGNIEKTSSNDWPQNTEFASLADRIITVDGHEAEVDYLGESTEGDLLLVDAPETGGVIDILGMNSVDDVVDTDYEQLENISNAWLSELGIDSAHPGGQLERGIFCTRTLNLRSIKCIGYDMDYTLIHYDVRAWEGKAFKYGVKKLEEKGFPVSGLSFDPDLVIRGLIVDKDLGNIVKLDRFGIVRRAMHGTKPLSKSSIREIYGLETVNLRNDTRWYFLNTFFSVSEANMYLQLVDLFDEGKIKRHGALSYGQLYNEVSKALFRTHVEGVLKSDIIKKPEDYVQIDPELPLTLLDQKASGKTLLLITNSEFEYTDKMMSFAYDRFLPDGMKWRDIFDMVIVNASKPEFFNHRNSMYKIVTSDGLMKPVFLAEKGGIYAGGSATQVENAIGVEGDDILYVGDHIYTDAGVAKVKFRWRTCLIIRELEKEITAIAKGREGRKKIAELMYKKDLVGDLFNHLRLGFVPVKTNGATLQCTKDPQTLKLTMAQILRIMVKLDEEIATRLERDGEDFSQIWGHLCRAGLHDKSALCRQIEKWADIYTSRVSNFHRYTPFMYFRSGPQSLSHDNDLNVCKPRSQ
eukprot:g3496.t1